jgi:peptide/nickel transport system substrate-binding protein
MAATDNYWQRLQRTRINRRRVLAGAGATAGLTLLAACGGTSKTSSSNSGTQSSGSNQTPVTGGTFNASQPSNPTGLDTHKNARVTTQQMIGGVQSRLFLYKTGIDPTVAESHDVDYDLATTGESQDGQTWTFKLNPDAKFSNTPPVNGHPVEAEDIRATFQRALTTPENANAGALSMIDYTQIQTPDKQTVVFKLKYPYAAFTHTLASGSYPWIFPREVLAGSYDPNKVVIGSGPFTLESYTPDVSGVYKKNPTWFVKGRPYIDGFKYAIIPDSSSGSGAAQALAQFTSGNLDTVSPTDNDLDQMKRDNPKATVVKGPPSVSANFVFGQMGDPSSKWADIRVRQAVSMAIDRDALAKISAPHGGEKQMVVGVAYGKWALHPDNMPADTAQYFKFNPAESKKLLAAAGLTNFPFKFIYTNNFYGTLFNTNAETVNGMLKQAGFNTTLVQIDYTREWVNGGKGIRYGSAPGDAFAWGITSGFDDADEVIFNYFDSQSSLRNTNLKDPTLDAMITKYRSILNEDDRVKAEIETQNYLAKQLYLVDGMTTPYTYQMHQPWVINQNYGLSYGVATEVFARLWLNKQ